MKYLKLGIIVLVFIGIIPLIITVINNVNKQVDDNSIKYFEFEVIEKEEGQSIIFSDNTYNNFIEYINFDNSNYISTTLTRDTTVITYDKDTMWYTKGTNKIIINFISNGNTLTSDITSDDELIGVLNTTFNVGDIFRINYTKVDSSSKVLLNLIVFIPIIFSGIVLYIILKKNNYND